MGMNVKSDENLFMDILSFVVCSFVFLLHQIKTVRTLQMTVFY